MSVFEKLNKISSDLSLSDLIDHQKISKSDRLSENRINFLNTRQTHIHTTKTLLKSKLRMEEYKYHLAKHCPSDPYFPFLFEIWDSTFTFFFIYSLLTHYLTKGLA